ncbi:leukotriene C4 synthase isoform 2-T2 [Liasis olivaceus]
MLHKIALLATVTILGVLEQAYFAIQVIAFRRKFKVSPPITSGPPEFERIFRAQVNCSEYFPIFLSLLWVAGIFSHQGWAPCISAPEFFAFLLGCPWWDYLSILCDTFDSLKVLLNQPAIPSN